MRQVHAPIEGGHNNKAMSPCPDPSLPPPPHNFKQDDRRHHHWLLTGGIVTNAIGICAVIKALLVLAILSKVGGEANTSTHGVLDTTVAIEGAVVLAVLGSKTRRTSFMSCCCHGCCHYYHYYKYLDGAVIPKKGWCTLAGAKSITYPVTLSWLMMRTRHLMDGIDVGVVVGVVITGRAAVGADLGGWGCGGGGGGGKER